MQIVEILEVLRGIHDEIRDAVVASCEQAAVESLSAIAADDEGDTIYAIDRVSEERLVSLIDQRIASQVGVILIAEGLPGDGTIALPIGIEPAACQYRIIVDPIDGTRGIMYQKRSAWILTGVAKNKGTETRLTDIDAAVMTEIPLIKQHLSDQLWAVRGQGVHALRWNRLAQTANSLAVRPSRAHGIDHGFAMISRFFPGRRDVLAAIDDHIVREVICPVQQGKAQCFEDQYISTGGQLYEMLVGHDRFNADIRPYLEPIIQADGNQLGICCHPYDCATFLIAEEAGIEICDPSGAAIDVPLDLETDVAWAAYANKHIRQLVEPALHSGMRQQGMQW